MMRDFSLDIYRELLDALQKQGYECISYADYIKTKTKRQKSKEKFVILRHDVDRMPQNSLEVAKIERSFAAKATYYFRVGKESNDPEIIRAIAKFGHEIGYHYEDLALAHGNKEKAYEHFKTWLEYFRYYYPVETICMHGAPTSRYDGRKLWEKYSYKDLGIIGEPYLDTNFGDVLYLTDTGRCWDGYHVSRRDKIPQYQDEWTAKGWTWHTTPELIAAIKGNGLPAHVMITTHPQRWTNHIMFWWRERVLQDIKNRIKRLIIR